MVDGYMESLYKLQVICLFWNWQLGLVLVGLSSVLRDNHQGASQGQVVFGNKMMHNLTLHNQLQIHCTVPKSTSLKKDHVCSIQPKVILFLFFFVGEAIRSVEDSMTVAVTIVCWFSKIKYSMLSDQLCTEPEGISQAFISLLQAGQFNQVLTIDTLLTWNVYIYIYKFFCLFCLFLTKLLFLNRNCFDLGGSKCQRYPNDSRRIIPEEKELPSFAG